MPLVETCMSGILGCGLGLKEGVCTRIIWSCRFGGGEFWQTTCNCLLQFNSITYSSLIR